MDRVSAAMMTILDRAFQVGQAFGRPWVGTEHLGLALVELSPEALKIIGAPWPVLAERAPGATRVPSTRRASRWSRNDSRSVGRRRPSQTRCRLRRTGRAGYSSPQWRTPTPPVRRPPIRPARPPGWLIRPSGPWWADFSAAEAVGPLSPRSTARSDYSGGTPCRPRPTTPNRLWATARQSPSRRSQAIYERVHSP